MLANATRRPARSCDVVYLRWFFKLTDRSRQSIHPPIYSFIYRWMNAVTRAALLASASKSAFKYKHLLALAANSHNPQYCSDMFMANILSITTNSGLSKLRRRLSTYCIYANLFVLYIQAVMLTVAAIPNN